MIVWILKYNGYINPKENIMVLNKKSLSFSVALMVGMLYSTITFSTHFTGPTELTSQQFKDLTVQGPLNFNGLQVQNKTEIFGPFSGENGVFNDLMVHGTCWGAKIQINHLEVDSETALEDFKVSGNVNIHAPLKAKNGRFNNIDAAQTPIALYNVTVNNITIKGKQNDIHEVKLAGNTVVSGNITFESGNGIVFIRDKTAILKGKIIGGHLKEKDTNP